MMKRSSAGLFILLLLVFFGCFVSRGLRQQGEPPIAFESGNPPLWLELGKGFSREGTYQINDEGRKMGVIDLALSFAPECREMSSDGPSFFETGERWSLEKNSHGDCLLLREWMRATRRIALGIALHPDRMDFEDWIALPGIGEKRAKAILRDRHKNGDFHSLEGLGRIKGIGEGSLNKWRKFF